MNKKGMTLVELLVYMAIAALLLAPVIMLMQNSSLNMTRSAVNTDLSMSGRDILNIMYEDIRNTGFKLDNMSLKTEPTYLHIKTTAGSGSSAKTVGDSSSFMSGNSAGGQYYDELTIRKGRLGVNGLWDGCDTVAYLVKTADSLVRVNVKASPASTDTTILARGVEALQFQYSNDLTNWEDHFAAFTGDYPNDSTLVYAKKSVKYIKVVLVLKDPKQLSPLKTAPAVEVVEGITITPETGDQALRERHEIVVPIPNNGLFPAP